MRINTASSLIAIFTLFLVIFIFQSTKIMTNIPFYDFDEAHRAENAKRMKEYRSPLVPLTGSVFDRVEDFKVQFKENPMLHLYYHIERPTLIYWLMMLSTSILGSNELAYRLPSFLLGLSTLVFFGIFATQVLPKTNPFAIATGFLSVVTSADLWLSSQYAQLDTGLTFFLFSSLVLILLYLIKKRELFLIGSALALTMAIFSKGQPAVIFIFPLIFLLITKKISWGQFAKFSLICLAILLPWILLLSFKFGLINVIKIFLGFAISTAITEYLHHHAPIFWYARWWWDSLRPGWSLFLAFMAVDFLHKNLDFNKKLLLTYILGGLILYSLAINKIWWYVLPLVPAIAFYVYLSSADYLKSREGRLINLSLALMLAALPIFWAQTNTIAMFYGIGITLLVFLLLQLNLSIKLPSLLPQILFASACIFALTAFYLHFPKITPYYWETKPVAQFFTTLPQKKCLWTKDMPPEAALFYSEAGEIRTLTNNVQILENCTNYLITPTDIRGDETSYFYKDKLIPLNDKTVVFQRGNIKLVKLD